MDLAGPPDGLWWLVQRLALATLLGAAIGLNRELSLKPAGLRTHALVSLGAALVTITGLVLIQPTGDLSAPSRVVQGIVAGIGFIGGGVILHGRRDRTVRGLTTAATIWIVSAAGIAVGAGLWRSAVIAVGMALIVLTLGRPIDRAVHRAKGEEFEDD